MYGAADPGARQSGVKRKAVAAAAAPPGCCDCGPDCGVFMCFFCYLPVIVHERLYPGPFMNPGYSKNAGKWSLSRNRKITYFKVSTGHGSSH